MGDINLPHLIKYLSYKHEDWVWIPSTTTKVRQAIYICDLRTGRGKTGAPWSLMTYRSSKIGEFQIHRETLPQKTQWRVPDGNTWLWPLLPTYPQVNRHRNTYTFYTWRSHNSASKSSTHEMDKVWREEWQRQISGRKAGDGRSIPGRRKHLRRVWRHPSRQTLSGSETPHFSLAVRTDRLHCFEHMEAQGWKAVSSFCLSYQTTSNSVKQSENHL